MRLGEDLGITAVNHALYIEDMSHDGIMFLGMGRLLAEVLKLKRPTITP
jgi:hypothetical protein